MANGQIYKPLEFANMQMVAGVFLSRAGDNVPNRPPEEQIVGRLTLGNTHASRFTPVQAEQFTQQYRVVTQLRNDPQDPEGTGLSATLFEKLSGGVGTGEYTLSLRSTEFRDDAVRDSKATREIKIKDWG